MGVQGLPRGNDTDVGNKGNDKAADDNRNNAGNGDSDNCVMLMILAITMSNKHCQHLAHHIALLCSPNSLLGG